jgi:drug/metabolite transporter (DMT)-like permease
MTSGPAAQRSRWLLALLVLIWGVSWPVVKIGVTAVPPIWFACLRYVVGTAGLVVIVAARGELIVPPRSDWKLIAVSGVLQMALYSALTALALARLPPGRSSVLAFSTPLWVVPLSVWWLGEQVAWRRGVGVGAGLAGVVVIASPALQSTARGQLVPYILLVGAAAGWAVSIVFVRAHRFQASALSLAPWQMLVAALLLLPCAIVVDGALPPLTRRGLASLAYVGPLATAFAYWAVVEVGRHVRATTISVTLLAVPSVGVLVSAVAFHETVNVTLGLGIALVTAGVLLTTADVSRIDRRAGGMTRVVRPRHTDQDREGASRP